MDRTGKHFTPTEDITLKNLVEAYTNKNGKIDWDKVAQEMPGRNWRACKARYRDYLKFVPKKEPWTVEEDQILLAKYEELGPRWVKIAKFLPDRNRIQCKNRYLSLIKEEGRINLLKSIIIMRKLTFTVQTLPTTPVPTQTQAQNNATAVQTPVLPQQNDKKLLEELNNININNYFDNNNEQDQDINYDYCFFNQLP